MSDQFDLLEAIANSLYGIECLLHVYIAFLCKERGFDIDVELEAVSKKIHRRRSL